ncbi:MAG: sulfatase-like hydrolase/transferase [Spirochaetota bacterium]
MIDQQRRDTLSCYGGTDCHTPHLDALANEGVVFENAYTTCAGCPRDALCKHVRHLLHGSRACRDRTGDGGARWPEPRPVARG